MICELCKRESGTQRFCPTCVSLAEILKPRAAKLTALLQRALQPNAKVFDNKLTHYRVQLKGFCCYVDMRDCPHMDAVPAYALNRGNREPWYPTTASTPLDPEIPFVTAVTHSKFCDWLQLKEV